MNAYQSGALMGTGVVTAIFVGIFATRVFRSPVIAAAVVAMAMTVKEILFGSPTYGPIGGIAMGMLIGMVASIAWRKRHPLPPGGGLFISSRAASANDQTPKS